MEKIWFEVFIDREGLGTQTLETFDSLKEAKAYKEWLFRKMDDNEGTLHIDKWANIETPTMIQEIE